MQPIPSFIELICFGTKATSSEKQSGKNIAVCVTVCACVSVCVWVLVSAFMFASKKASATTVMNGIEEN